MIKHSIPINEPEWGKSLLLEANGKLLGCETFVSNAYLFADGLVFTYPVLLVVWYLIGLQQDLTHFKYGALYVFSSALLASAINLTIQFFVDKQRPEGYINNADLLILDHLPTAPFPSDHAAVSFAVAFATLLRATHHNNTPLVVIGVFLFIGAIIMGVSRVGVGIHWPTDIVAGAIVGIMVAYLIHPFLYEAGVFKGFLDMLVQFQNRLFSKVGF